MAGKHPLNKLENYSFFKRIFEEFMFENVKIHQTDHFHPHDYDEYKHLDAQGVVALFEDFNDYCRENLNLNEDIFNIRCEFELEFIEGFDFKNWNPFEPIIQIPIRKKAPPAIYISKIRRILVSDEQNIFVKKPLKLFQTRSDYNQYITFWRDENKECYKDFKLSTHFW
jgi:hypothetical protein